MLAGQAQAGEERMLSVACGCAGQQVCQGADSSHVGGWAGSASRAPGHAGHGRRLWWRRWQVRTRTWSHLSCLEGTVGVLLLLCMSSSLPALHMCCMLSLRSCKCPVGVMISSLCSECVTHLWVDLCLQQTLHSTAQHTALLLLWPCCTRPQLLQSMAAHFGNPLLTFAVIAYRGSARAIASQAFKALGHAQLCH